MAINAVISDLQAESDTSSVSRGNCHIFPSACKGNLDLQKDKGMWFGLEGIAL